MTGVLRHEVASDSQRLAAALMIAGPLMLIIAGIVTPSGLYQEPDESVRSLIIDREGPRFILAQVLWALWLLLPAMGLVLLSRHLKTPIAWLPTAAALSLVAGAVAGVVFVALQTADPQRYWLEGQGTWVSTAGAWLIIAAAMLYGFAMIQAPGWSVAGYVLAGYAVVGAGALFLSAPAFYVIAGFSLAALAPAFVLRAGSRRTGDRDTRDGGRHGDSR